MRTHSIKKYLPILLLILVTSCKKDNEVKTVSGYYKIISFKAETGADLNNDGVKSDDIYAELSKPHFAVSGQQISGYNFNNHTGFMEMRPTDHQSNPAKLVSFNIPHQHIDSVNGTPFLAFYLPVFTTYSYKEGNNNTIELLNNNVPYNEKFGSLYSFQILESANLQLHLSKKIFCFVEKNWIRLNMTIQYEKVQ
ncbi:MAG: hypothetical protein H7Y86_04765 [Rhizobacter sp.]|nr:hypothetical protein [Ferruginibacter sp.]